MTKLFFNDGSTFDVDLDPEDVWVLWKAHKEGIAVIRFKVRLRRRQALLSFKGFDAERTFRECIIQSFPSTVPPESEIRRAPISSTLPSRAE